MTKPILKIANCSGFYGDRFSALREQVEGGEIDILCGDYLAELTMVILRRQMERDASAGYCKTFVQQVEPLLAQCLERGIKIVVNAGGLNPHGCAAAVRAAAARRGLDIKIAIVDGDDVLSRVQGGEFLSDMEQKPLCANVYLGARGIARGLAAGADMVITGRVVDSALVLGPAAWRFGWRWDDWDRLAAGVVAGHLLECGPQVTGGNYALADEIRDFRHMGFPIAEMSEAGDFIVTKHPNTGGAVTAGTVIAQALYEIGAPAYATPDVTACFDTFTVADLGDDRVRVAGCLGLPPPDTLKLSLHVEAGWRNAIEIAISPGDGQRKVATVKQLFWQALGGRDAFLEIDEQEFDGGRGGVLLRLAARAASQEAVGRRFSNAAVELALASIAGLTFTAPPAEAKPCYATQPVAIPRSAIKTRLMLPDGTVEELAFD